MAAADRVLARCDALAALSEMPGAVCRTHLTPQHAEANALVAAWMREAGMSARVDAAGNLVGRYEGAVAGAPAVMLGSHLDTVRDAGRYDGILGVLLGLEAVGRLEAGARRLPVAVEVAGFGDEEGVRFGTALIGSSAMAGRFDPAWLGRTDGAGVALADAMRGFGLDPGRVREAARRPGEILAYLEAHIEQGPVLEQAGAALGVVTAICGAVRARYRVRGVAGHAGTVPMRLRRDAGSGTAEMIVAIERIALAHDIVATVGRIALRPDAVNVIPGEATFTLDIRAAADERRDQALAVIDAEMQAIAARRGLPLDSETLYRSSGVPCDPTLQELLAGCLAAAGQRVLRLPSGAGHDAQAMAALAPIAMLFLRCRGGISHNPAEAVEREDVAAALEVLYAAVIALAERQRG